NKVIREAGETERRRNAPASRKPFSKGSLHLLGPGIARDTRGNPRGMLKTFLRRFRSNGRPSMRQLAGIVDSLSWQKVDALYDQCRLKLRTEPRWRYGSTRIHSTAGEWLGALQRHGGIAEKCYLDLGCGSHHPFGVSTVMYLNGASRAYAV